jgi:RNA polymerase sigma-70 factor (ECF subfamily)
LYHFARRSGCDPHDAQDLTQGFFLLLLQKRWLEAVDRNQGKLRSYLIAAFKHYMAKEWRKARAQRRGGERQILPLDTAIVERRLAVSPSHTLSADEVYDREWALTLLNLSVERLREECCRTSRPGDFDVLKGTLLAVRGGIDYAGVARRLETSEGAARVTVHRFRKRFRAIFREEIAQTLNEGGDLETEMQHLAAALAGGEG